MLSYKKAEATGLVELWYINLLQIVLHILIFFSVRSLIAEGGRLSIESLLIISLWLRELVKKPGKYEEANKQAKTYIGRPLNLHIFCFMFIDDAWIS